METQAETALEVTDLRTRRPYRIPIEHDAIRATELAKIGDDAEGEGLASYDPALVNTASCMSAITYIDGERGVLRYRGYPIEQLPGAVRYLDVAHLLIRGELPVGSEGRDWADAVGTGADLPEPITRLVETFPPDAHPMSVLLAAWSALGAYRGASAAVDDPSARAAEVPRFLGSIVALVGLVFRHRTGRPLAGPAVAETDHATRLYRELFPDVGAPDPASSMRSIAC